MGCSTSGLKCRGGGAFSSAASTAPPMSVRASSLENVKDLVNHEARLVLCHLARRMRFGAAPRGTARRSAPSAFRRGPCRQLDLDGAWRSRLSGSHRPRRRPGRMVPGRRLLPAASRGPQAGRPFRDSRPRRYFDRCRLGCIGIRASRLRAPVPRCATVRCPIGRPPRAGWSGSLIRRSIRRGSDRRRRRTNLQSCRTRFPMQPPTPWATGSSKLETAYPPIQWVLMVTRRPPAIARRQDMGVCVAVANPTSRAPVSLRHSSLLLRAAACSGL